MVTNENTKLFIEATAGILTLAIIVLTFLFVRLNRRTKTTIEALSYSYNILEREIANHRKLAIKEHSNIKDEVDALRLKVSGIDLSLMALQQFTRNKHESEQKVKQAEIIADNKRPELAVTESDKNLDPIEKKWNKNFITQKKRNKKGQFTKAKKK